ncbi:MAG TPA: LysM domain-containing protein [Solirubrobacterales bacterium]|jgi:LysM repeat protein|nr:LysM domain-containing protein [Solirubrobacterales bacterium]
MQKRNTAPARVFATIALVGGFLVVVLVISTSLGGGGSTGSQGHANAGKVARGGGGGGGTVKTQASYVVQNGDTLISIAHKTGVSVVRIQALNPSVDPQILISGEKLKLR